MLSSAQRIMDRIRGRLPVRTGSELDAEVNGGSRHRCVSAQCSRSNNSMRRKDRNQDKLSHDDWLRPNIERGTARLSKRSGRSRRLRAGSIDLGFLTSDADSARRTSQES